jgi:hypothetical protein
MGVWFALRGGIGGRVAVEAGFSDMAFAVST